MARQDSRDRSPEKDKDAVSYETGTAKMEGHVVRMPDERLPKKSLYGELQVGKCSHGGFSLCLKSLCQTLSNAFNIYHKIHANYLIFC